MTPEENARLEAIEQRLASLEARLDQLSAAPRPVVKNQAPVAAPKVQTTEERPRRDIETAVGLTWLSRIAVLTIVLALAFFFKYAFENHWITEWGRVLLGAGCGLVALVFGERLWRTGQAAYGQAVTAAGIAFLYLSCWAASGLYHVIPQPAGFASMVLVTVAAGALALRYDSQAVAVLGLIGGFVTPLLLGSRQDAWFVFGYALVLDGGTAFATRRRRWLWLEPLALAGTIVLYVSQTPVPPESRAVYTFFALAWYGLFAASEHSPVMAAAQVLAGLAVVQIWSGGEGALATALLIAATGLAVAVWRGWATAVGASFAGFWLAYGAWAAYAGGAPPVFAPLAAITLAFGLFLGWPVWRALGRRLPLRFADLAVMALNAGFYFGAAYWLLSAHYGVWRGLLAVAVGAAHMAAGRALWRQDQRGGLLAAGVAWVLLVLAAPIQFAGYRITIAWAAEAAAVVWIGTRLAERRAVDAALAVFVLVWARLLLLDGRMYSSHAAYSLLGNARFLTFVVAALSLWAAAWWIRQGWRALVAYLGGHIVMLWGLCLEAVAWAGRTSAPQNFPSVASTSISVLTAAYAVLLVAGGVARRNAVTRVAGIVLIGLVILKLYLYDIWLLGQFYRMTAFGILGALLLAMSYLYSRFRGSIESWWRPRG